jgi:DNA-binding winged helix-turn-helix (wHTH) protein
VHRFGLFEFDAAAGELRRQGRQVRLEPQPTRALALLVSRPSELISREEMRAHIWGAGTHVDVDRGLAYCIGQVRTALGDSADNPRFVETLTRRGYRFNAPVQTATDGPPEPAEPGRPGPNAEARDGRRRGPVVVLAIVVLIAVAGIGWSLVTGLRAIVAVAVFDNETGRAEFDSLAGTAADVMV